MKLTWFGHSCFCIESVGYKILTDPYRDVPGLKDICAEANAVLQSQSL